MQERYDRKGQPHIYPVGATIGFTFLAHDAVPKPLLIKLKEAKLEKEERLHAEKPDDMELAMHELHRWYQMELEALLAAKRAQEHPFLNPDIAQAVLDRLHLYDGVYYNLDGYSLMSNHLHALLDFSVQCPPNYDGMMHLPDYYSPKRWVGNYKGASSRQANQAADRDGPLWMQHNNYNRYMRDANHQAYTLNYFVRNPEVAGLVSNWREHPYTYASKAMLELFALS